MKRKLLSVAAIAIVALSLGAPATQAGSSAAAIAPTLAEAAVTKSLAASAGHVGSVGGTGTRLGGLLSGIAVPVITALAGCLLIGALASRNIGAGVGIVLITIIGLIFLLAPQAIEAFAKGIASVVF